MIEPPIILERFSRVAPFGVRFWDTLTATMVGDGLRVTAVHDTHAGRTLHAFPNRSGVYVLHDVPGMREFAHGTGESDFWTRFPPSQAYRFTVEDTLGRFLPISFVAQLPVQGLFTLDCLPMTSPPAQPRAAIPLFSTPRRVLAGGLAVLRAELWDATNERAAAWALIEVSAPRMPPVLGLADGDGRIALPFPYPEPPTPAISSPVGGPGRRPLALQMWTIRLNVFYEPITPVPRAPFICDALAQAPARLWSDPERTRELTTTTLSYGQDLVVRSDLPADFDHPSVLLVTPM